MAVFSSPTPLGTDLPDQTLADVHGTAHNLRELRGSGVLVVVFSANHCPYVQHIESALGEVAAEYQPRGASFTAICSNDPVQYAEDAAPGLQAQAERAQWHFPYLIDADQDVARDFGAVCTPDFFVYDINGKLGYRGAFDASSPKNGEPLNGADLRRALDLLLAAQPVPEPQRPAMGCSIKWRE